jgi:hypothetical protein
MLEYTKAGGGARLAMLVLYHDAEREYAYGSAQGLPDTKVGTFTQALYDEAKKNGWTVMSVKKDPFFPGEHRMHPLFEKASALNEREFNRRQRREQRMDLNTPFPLFALVQNRISLGLLINSTK